MAKLNINLLPPELEAEKKQKVKFSSTLKISIIFLVVVIGMAAVVLSLRLAQNVVLTNANKDFDKAKATLTSPEYNQKEGLVITLKDRLESIGKLLGQETYGSYAFSLVSDLAPIDVRLSAFAIDNKGLIQLTAETSNLASLETFLNQVVTPGSNQNKITAVTIEGINRARTDIYRTELSIILAGSSIQPK